MRSALLSCVALLGALAASAIACSTFADAEDETPQPTVDAGPDVTNGAACTPAEPVDPASPDPACGDILGDAKNCGGCGHVCIDSACTDGRCAIENVGPPVNAIARDGTTLYAQQGFDIVRADLTKRPYVFEQFFAGVTDVKRMEVFGGELFVSTSAGQSVIAIGTKAQRENEQLAIVNNPKKDGFFFPGVPSYYEYKNETDPVWTLARIDSATSVDAKTSPSFDPIARSGAEIYWTETLSGGALIHGPWESDPSQPLARVGAPISALFAENGTVYFVANERLIRTDRTSSVALAVEKGVASAFAVDGTELYYAVRRESTAQIRHYLMRVDKCNGGRPLALYDSNVPITDILLVEDDHVTVRTTGGFFRVRR